MRALPCGIGFVAALSAVGIGAPARADSSAPSYIAPPARDVVVESPGDRTTENQLVIGGIAVVGVGLGALGLHYNLDARDDSNAVSQSMLTGRVWSPAFQAQVDAAHSESTKAIVFYSIGGAAVIAAAVAYIATEPPVKRVVMHTGVAHARPLVLPVQSGAGAVAGAVWTW
jgi:hypothetical protein|nr:hypothetical protein [Kofleriaceae bacterium]